MQQKEEDKKVIQFFQGQPESIYDAITMHSNHIHQMYIAYSYLCNVTKDNTQIGEFIKSDKFEIQLKEAFNCTDSIISTEFIAYIEQFFLNTNDIPLLEKVYNFLTIKMNELLRQPKRLKFNPSYPHYNTLYENANRQLILYLQRLGNELDANGNYKEVKDYFTADNLIDAIALDLKETKDKIDSLFTLKKLNEKLQNNSLSLIELDKERGESTTSEIMPENECRTTNKQQIILLEELGFFDLPIIKEMTVEKKGLLVSLLLNRNKKNTTEYIRNLDTPKQMVSKDNYFVKTQENLKRIKEIKEETGL